MGRKKKNLRRANGEGTIFQRKDGRWVVAIVNGPKEDGSLNREYRYAKSETEAKEILKQISQSISSGTYYTSKILLGDAMKEWLRLYKKSLVSDRTYEGNIRTFKNHIEPNLGKIPYSKITSNMVQELLTKSLQNHNGCPNTPKRIKFLLNQFYEYLISNKQATENPALRCKVSGKYKKTFMDSKGRIKQNANYKAIPEKERIRFIRALDKGPDIIKPISLVMMLASLRVGEALGLKWENVDFEKGLIYVEQGLTEKIEFDDNLNILKRENIISTTKTACSKRVLKMPQILIDALQKWRKIQWCKEQVSGVPLTKPHNLIFCKDDGGVRGYDALRRQFDRFTKKYGFRDEFGIHCHMLRQTFSNMQIENKRNIKDVQHLLGHKDAKTTQLHYNSIVEQEVDYEGAELLDNLFNEQTIVGGNSEFEPKDVPAYHIDTDNYKNEILEDKHQIINSEIDMEIEILQKMIEEKQKRKNQNDIEM